MARELPNGIEPKTTPVDWSTFDTGRTWELVKGTDFHQSPRQAAHAARQWARYHGRTVTIRVKPDRIFLLIHPE